MAVYTVLDRDQIQSLLAPLGIGRVAVVRGIAEGIENSNYMIVAERDGAIAEYVLTIAESQSLQDIIFIAELTTLLRRQGVPVPAPLTDGDGNAVLQVGGKPAVLMPKIAGDHPLTPDAQQCRAIGSALGHFHRVTLEAGLQHQSHRSLEWVAATGRALRLPRDFPDRKLLDRELTALEQLVTTHLPLPRAVIHGDLFRDNTLFQGAQLTAIIDFFSAGSGFLMFDLAVVANDWCAGPGNTLDRARLMALLQGYSEQREPIAEERQMWPQFLCVAALRFWVSRLAEQTSIPARAGAGTLLTCKDPREYRDILFARITHPQPWPR